MDIVAPPKMAEPPKQPAQQDTPTPVDHAKTPQAHAAKQRVPLQPQRSGMGLVALATVIIVLGLGVCMVYAYLRTNGIRVL
jgi:hypothetical protein